MKSLQNAILLTFLFCIFSVNQTLVKGVSQPVDPQPVDPKPVSLQEKQPKPKDPDKQDSAKQKSDQSKSGKSPDKPVEKPTDENSSDQKRKQESKNAGKTDKPQDSENDSQESTDDSSKQEDSSNSSDSTGSDSQPIRDNTPTPIDWSIEGTMELNFDHMKFNIQPDEDFEIKQLTADLIKLRGHRIRIRGYIRPSFRSKGITSFILVRDNQTCCFGPGAALYDCMKVQMAEGETTDFSTRPVTVEGTFYLKPYRIEDKVMAILQLKDAKVE